MARTAAFRFDIALARYMALERNDMAWDELAFDITRIEEVVNAIPIARRGRILVAG